MRDTKLNRLFPNLVLGVEDILTAIIDEGVPADKAIAHIFKVNLQWGSRDRSFVAETVYDIVRYLRHYAPEAPDGRPSVPWPVVTGWHLLKSGYELIERKAWENLPPVPVVDEFSPLAVRESVTDWMDQRGAGAWGERWPALLHALNKQATVVLRVNSIRVEVPRVMDYLRKNGIETRQIDTWAIELVERANVFRTSAFADGWFEVQDFASQQIAPALDIQPGQRIVDACAGAGGKTLHIANLAHNKGQIVALDIDDRKMRELKRRARRSGSHNITTIAIDSSKRIKRLFGSADRLLLDVPCTGTGVLRRNPDTKWRVDQAYLDTCYERQAKILRQYAPICKPGGKIVYATCSILREENEGQIEKFITEHPTYKLLEQRHLLPDEFGYDGFYYAVIEAGEPITTPHETEDSPDVPLDN